MKTINKAYKRIITRVLANEASASDKEQLNAWLSRSEEHRQLYAQYKKIWALQPEESEDTVLNTQQAWHNVMAKIEADETARTNTYRKLTDLKAKNKRMYWLSGAAAAFLVLVAISIFLQISESEINTMTQIAHQDEESVLLDDGTRVQLRAGAELEYPEFFTESNRKVKLKGDAFFEVAFDKQRPFYITLNNAGIEVLGTSFYVEHTAESVSVFVNSGSVRLMSKQENGPKTIIRSDEVGEYLYSDSTIVVRTTENSNHIAWKTGKLAFMNENLSNVFLALEKTYGIKVQAPDAIKDLQLTGRFINETPEDILASLGLAFGFKWSKVDDTYLIQVDNQRINNYAPNEQP